MPVSISGDGAITGLELESFEDVDVGSGASDGDVLTYDATGDLWIPQGVVLPAAIGSNVVNAETETVFTTTSATYVAATDLSVTITPSSATSKILIIANVTLSCTPTAADDIAYAAVHAGGADIGLIGSANNRGDSNGAANHFAFDNSVVLLHSPATTSAVTYDIRIKQEGTSTAQVNRRIADTNQDYSSSITAIEVAA